MSQNVLSLCNCCGQAVDTTNAEVCPNCQYPLNSEKEQLFLEKSLYDLRRVIRYGGSMMSVAALVHRYEARLQFLLDFKARAASPDRPVSAPTQSIALGHQPTIKRIQSPAPVSFRPKVFSEPPLPAPRTGSSYIPVSPTPHAVVTPESVPVMPAASLRGFSLSSDAMANVVAALGGFLVLAGALSFIITTSNLWLSLIVVFLIHAAFGGAGLFTRRRFPLLQAVSTLYILIFALLVPLVGFSAYRLVTNGEVALSTPLLLTLASLYAAAIYSSLAIVQRFIPFAYLSICALLVGDLAFAQTLQLSYWWWPCMAMLLALPLLLAVPRASNAWPFTEARAILRTPLQILMYTIVGTVVPLTLLGLVYSLALSSQEPRVSLLCLSCLLFVWCCLWIWRTGKTRWTSLAAYLFLTVLLLAGYVANLNSSSYILLLAASAAFYHLLMRREHRLLVALGLRSLTLDQIALGLSVLVLWLTAATAPIQLLVRAYTNTSTQNNASFLFGTGWFFGSVANSASGLLALGVCLLITLDITILRAGFERKPARPAWCWLLLFSGSLLIAFYGLLVLDWRIFPLGAFLALSLALLAGMLLVRRFASSAWAYPLDTLTFCVSTFVLLLSVGQSQNIISALLLGYAALFYIVLLYQRRPLPSLFITCLTLLALPLLLRNEPIAVLALSLLLPLLAAWMQRTGQPDDKASKQWSLFTWSLLIPGLFFALATTGFDALGQISIFAGWSGWQLPIAAEIALPGIAWYVAALLAGKSFWLIPATLFGAVALLFSTGSVWTLSVLTLCLALLAVGSDRRGKFLWALPFYLLALFGAVLAGYIGLVQQQTLATSWILLGFALVAYGAGLFTRRTPVLWLTPLFATWAIIMAAALLGDLFRPPLVALGSAVLGIICSRVLSSSTTLAAKRSSTAYALPFYVTALSAATLTGVYGMFGDINRPFYGALPLALLVYALVAFVVLWIETQPRLLWIVAIFACWSVFLGQQLNLSYLLGASFGLVLLGWLGKHLLPTESTEKQTAHVYWFAAPWYAAALLAALLVGIQGTLGDINRPFYGAVPLALLLYALLALVAFRGNRRPGWNILAAGLACWSMLLAQRLTPIYILIGGIGMALLGLLLKNLWRPEPVNEENNGQKATRSGENWPWYGAFLVAVFALGNSPARFSLTTLIVAGLLIFTILATIVMLVERIPELLALPAGIAAWAIALWLTASHPTALILAYTVLCIFIFSARFIWRRLPASTHWLPTNGLSDTLSLGGLVVVVLGACQQGALNSGPGWLAQSGVLALATLSLLLFLYGWLQPATVARALGDTVSAQQRAARLSAARSVQHGCAYAAGFLFSLTASWELLAFYQTRFDLLTLVPASFLIVAAPFLLRDQALPERRMMGQLLAIVGAAFLLLPSLWFSFNGVDVLPTLILLGEALILLTVGLVARMRIFILSSAALLVIGTLRTLFLSIPPSIPILLILFGSLLVLLATILLLFRHRLHMAWERWE